MFQLNKDENEQLVTNCDRLKYLYHSSVYRIIHGYNSVSDDIIWLIANRHLPIIEQKVKELLKYHSFFQLFICDL